MQNLLLTELGQALVNGNLTDAELQARTDSDPVLRILPDATLSRSADRASSIAAAPRYSR